MSSEPTQLHIPDSPTQIAEGLPPAPLPERDSPPEKEPNIRSAEPSFKEVFLAWEKLRLVYNVTLAVVVLAFLLKAGPGMLNVKVAVDLISGALGANLFFCLGLAGEGYLCWLGLPHRTTRWVLFCWGTVFSIIVTAPWSEGLVKPFLP